MRLWHEKLIPLLPRQQLLGQHRECCALRGKGWGKSHSVVNYVFQYDRAKLVAYHIKVMTEMKNRGYNVDSIWLNVNYRGKLCSEDNYQNFSFCSYASPVYSEHNNNYLKECIDNLSQKGIRINVNLCL